jgi:anti-sigma B factor antagonist
LHFAVIELGGELDLARRVELRDALRFSSETRAVLLDLSEVTYADSTVLTELLRFKTAADEEHIPVALVAAHAQFTRILSYAGLDEAFQVFKDRGEALSYLEKAS